jgi:hypothetical protein
MVVHDDEGFFFVCVYDLSILQNAGLNKAFK